MNRSLLLYPTYDPDRFLPYDAEGEMYLYGEELLKKIFVGTRFWTLLGGGHQLLNLLEKLYWPILPHNHAIGTGVRRKIKRVVGEQRYL